MDARPKFFSSHLSRTERWVYGAVTVFMILACVVTLWPIYPLFGGVRPFVLGLPFDLFYLAAILVISFSVLLALFIWEGRREARARREGRDGGAEAPDERAPGDGEPDTSSGAGAA